ncbi:MAG: membrane dipeptidase [Planctomycetota bacterium]|jgi:membrane dipeptidase
MRRLPLLLLPLAACSSVTPPPSAYAEADEIHARCLTLDTHKDISSQMAPRSLPSDPATAKKYRAQFDPTVRGSQQVDFVKMREGQYDCAFFIVYTPQRKLTDSGYHGAYVEANKKFDAIHRMCDLYPNDIALARTADDVERLHRENKLIACIGIENGYPMGLDLKRIEEFHAKGARYMGIAHNGHTQLGDSHTPAEPMHGGLSELGVKAVSEMNRVGIMVDVSHASKATMLHAVRVSKAPVIASHSGARAVNDHSRNLDDEQLRAIAKNNGVVQCVALASFLKSNKPKDEAVSKLREELGLSRNSKIELTDEQREENFAKLREARNELNKLYPQANVSDYADHIEHIINIAGINHVGIGSDFDGGGGITGWSNASESRNVTRELLFRGHTEADVQKIWSGNLLRVLRAVEAVAAASK